MAQDPFGYSTSNPGGETDLIRLQRQIQELGDRIDTLERTGGGGTPVAPFLPEESPLLGVLVQQFNELAQRVDRLLSESQPQVPELSIPAWDDESPRGFIGLGNAIVEGSGITIARVADTPYLSISSNPAANDVDALHLTGLNSAKPATAVDGALYTSTDTDQLWTFMAS